MRLLLVIFTIQLTGCAHTTTVSCLEPAEIDVAGMHRVMVVPFTGDEGTDVAAALSSRLWDNNFYDVIDRSELGPAVRQVGHAEGPSIDELLKSARDAGVDGVIVGSVAEYRCDDQFSASAEESIRSDEQLRFDRDLRSAQSDVSAPREASVVINFQMIDVETGEVRTSRQITRQYVDRPGEVSSESPGEILDSLAIQCVDEIVDTLAPHEGSCELQLAKCDYWTKGSRDVKRGLKLAGKGDWDGAERAWQEAIASNPENHAAHFNLAIAATRRQEYDTAELHALDALRIEHSSCYTAGLEKMRQRRTARTRANDQREQRVATALGETIWQ